MGRLDFTASAGEVGEENARLLSKGWTPTEVVET